MTYIPMQMQHYRVCQKCGRTIAAADAEAAGWLVGPYKRRPELGLLVVRCPAHWSEWALRNSIGRTKANRQKMAEGRERAKHEAFITPIAEPFPLVDRP